MITTITYISLFCGGLLILLMLLSLLGGLDLDFDFGDTDTDVDAGGLGVVKSTLTFVSVCLWIIRIALLAGMNPGVAATIGIGAGVLAVLLLTLLLRLLLKNQENVNWSPDQSINKMAKVYLRIPTGSSGLIHININGATRELKAKTNDLIDIATGEEVYVQDYQNGFAIVSKMND